MSGVTDARRSNVFVNDITMLTYSKYSVNDVVSTAVETNCLHSDAYVR